MRVVRDRRRERPALEPGAAHEAEADAAGREVPLDHGDLREVARRVGDREPVLDRRHARRATRSRPGPATSPITRIGPPRHGAARSARASGAIRTDWRTHSGTSRPEDLADRLPRLQHELGPEGLEVGQDEQVGLVAGRDAPRCESRARSPGSASRDERVLRRDADRDRLAHHAVDVAVVADVVRVAVVGAERDPRRARTRARAGASAVRFRAIDASRMSSQMPARSRSRPSSSVSASWSERIPAAA